MPGLVCNACNVEFPDEGVQKAHYRSDWHRYNLKRKVAGVPGVTERLFTLRLEALAAEKKKAEGERLLYKCSLCGKEYTTERAHLQHLQSKLHVSKAASLGDASSAGVAVTRPAPNRPVKDSVSDSRGKEVDVSDSDEDWEEVGSDEAEDSFMGVRGPVNDAEAPTSSSDDALGDWDPTRCFVCDVQPDGTIEGCVEHLHKLHGFFIPDAEYLKDPRGMITYLGLKVTKGFMCLFCDDRGKRFQSLEAVRKHMISKSHCKLRYGDGEGAEEELEEFYDFSSSYVDSDGKELMRVLDGEAAPVQLVSGGLELLLKGEDGSQGGKTIGSRELFRYYKQKPKPVDRRDGVAVNAVIARYRSMGLATREESRRIPKSVDGSKTRASRLEHMRTGVGMRNNVNWNLPRNVTH